MCIVSLVHHGLYFLGSHFVNLLIHFRLTPKVTQMLLIAEDQRMKAGELPAIPKMKIGQDVINMYIAYQNSNTVWKKHTLVNVVFELPEYYKPVSLIGSGAYGAVAIAYDTRVPEDKRQENMVAIKKMTNAFEHRIYTRRVLRQLKLLRLLKHPNIVEIKTIILPKSRIDFQDIYVVFEVMDSDICNVLRKGEQKLSEAHYQYFIYQVLRGLAYAHSGGVIHRDIKTRNLLINSDCNVKICDFGLARLIINPSKKVQPMTDYVATRWYRAPQLLLGETNYTPAVDVWSVGCVLAELELKKPFLPATSTKEQLELICQMVEMPDLEALKDNNGVHYQIVIDILKKKKKKKPNLIDEKLKNLSEPAIDLVKKMLTFESSKRITAKQALNHPYFKDFREPDLQKVMEPINPLEFEFEGHSLTTQQLKDLIYEQTLLYHFPAFQKSYQQKIKNKTGVLTHILKNSNANNINPYTDAEQDQDE